MTRLIDANGTSTRWGYDSSGRLTAKAYADGGREAWAYPVASNGTTTTSTGVVEHTNSRGEVTSLIYDDNGNLAKIDYPGGTPSVSFAYNELNKPLAMQDGLGTTNYSYDGQGRLTSVDGPLQNDTVSYTYDAQGRRQTLGVQGGASGGVQSVNYGYDALGRLNQVSSAGGTWGYSYVGLTGMIAGMSGPNGETTNYSYDSFDRLTGVQSQASGGSNISSYSYAYDEGNPNSAHRPVRVGVTVQVGADAAQTTNWAYDATDQLSGETQRTTGQDGGAVVRDTSYQYDGMGNRTQSTTNTTQSTGTTSTTVNHAPNRLNQTTALLVTTGTTSTPSDLGYDSEGNLTTWNTNGATPSAAGYSYDAANRLVSITHQSGGVNTTKVAFDYDGLSRRVRTRNYSWTNGQWALQDDTFLVYDGMNVVQERDGSTGAVKAMVTRGADMGGGIGGILCRSTSTGNFSFHYDGRGNVTQLTDASGTTVGRYTYDAFGNTLEARGTAAADNPYRFSTKAAVDGLYDYGFRFYAPSLGKWINRDPILEQGGVNVYAFVVNAPTGVVDTDGQAPIPVGNNVTAGVFIGFVAGAGHGAVGGMAANLNKQLWLWLSGCRSGFDFNDFKKEVGLFTAQGGVWGAVSGAYAGTLPGVTIPAVLSGPFMAANLPRSLAVAGTAGAIWGAGEAFVQCSNVKDVWLDMMNPIPGVPNGVSPLIRLIIRAGGRIIA